MLPVPGKLITAQALIRLRPRHCAKVIAMRRIGSGLILLALCSSGASADDHAIGVKAGFLGIGLEYSYRFTDKLVVRGGLNGSNYSFDDTESGIDYDFTLDFDSVMVGIDLHPFEGAFRLSGGFLQTH